MKTVVPLLWALLVILIVCQGTAPNPNPAASAAPGIVLPPRWARNTAHNPCALQGWQLVLWPADGHCYRVFQQGPCPIGQELVVNLQGEPLCRCLPGHLRIPELTGHICYPAYKRGPCAYNHYLRPTATHSDIGECTAVATCPPVQAVWPPSGQCYKLQQPPARGPCAWGELLLQDSENAALAHCDCKPQIPGYHRQTRSCHQLFTKGPCEEGRILLPDGKCGCNKELKQYHAPTQTCHTLGHRGPCHHGQILVASSSGSSAQCECSAGRVSVHGAKPGCWRPLSRGPCHQGFVVFEDGGGRGTCEPEPCPQGLLLHLDSRTCHRPGTDQPCPEGQRLLFSDVDPGDVSFLGICDCPTAHECATKKGRLLEMRAAHKMENSELEANETITRLYNRQGKIRSEHLVDQINKHILPNESKNMANVSKQHVGNHRHHKQHHYFPVTHYDRNNEHTRNQSTLHHQNAEQQKHYSADYVSQKAKTNYQYNTTQILEDIHKHIKLVTERAPVISNILYTNESNNTYKQEQILEDIQKHFPIHVLNTDQEKSRNTDGEHFGNIHIRERSVEMEKRNDAFFGTVIIETKTEKPSNHLAQAYASQRRTDASQKQVMNSCDNIGWALWLGKCYKLYERGPCQHGAWLVPDIAHSGEKQQNQAVMGQCKCQPGYHQGDIPGECQSQLVAVSKYLSHFKKNN